MHKLVDVIKVQDLSSRWWPGIMLVWGRILDADEIAVSSNLPRRW